MKKNTDSAISHAPKRRGSLFQWEYSLFIAILAIIAILFIKAPTGVNARVLLDITFLFIEKGILTIPLALIIIMGDIDISVGSTLAMVSVVFGVLMKNSVNVWIALPVLILVGIAAGFFNGFMIVKTKVPSIAITLGTFTLYRGIAYILLENQTINVFPEKLAFIGQGYIFNIVPIPLLIFVILAVVFGLILHRSTFGRGIYLIGNNRLASLYSGVKINNTRIILFTLMGFVAAIGAIILTFRQMNTRPNIAMGFEFECIIMAVMGGVSIMGGKGKMIGVVLGIYFVGLSRNVLYILNVPSETMRIIIGAMLIFAILIPEIMANRKKRLLTLQGYEQKATRGQER